MKLNSRMYGKQTPEHVSRAEWVSRTVELRQFSVRTLQKSEIRKLWRLKVASEQDPMGMSNLDDIKAKENDQCR